ncbi:CHAD domain-containing protein [Sulfolobus sp. S-194]|uniref:CHAD domain-containing protein n=1 Tax=Sulfolobus sp. S-194 TaxID=2512240 RepID=UPI00143726E7|nr:CHAD domain-containing protein [Sulfolobus sp. S-194]QIW24419.1 CHAD domain-containing protein [Sulfolobus sp. S-194]
MKTLRPEEYANLNLKEVLLITKIDEESIHDARVNLRKYYDVLISLYPIYENSECAFISNEIIGNLGRIRDMDICGLRSRRRDELAYDTIKKFRQLKICYLPVKIYGSRLLLFRRIYSLYELIPRLDDFHEIRKRVRIIRNLTEALGYNSQEVKIIAKKMGDVRDNILKMECNGLAPPEINVSVYKEEAINAIIKIIKEQDEFHYRFINLE